MITLTAYLYAHAKTIPYVLAAVIIIGFLCLVFIVLGTDYVLKKTKTPGKPGEKEKHKKEKFRMPPWGGKLTRFLATTGVVKISDLSANFLKALNFLENHLEGGDYRYKLPWYLMIGSSNSGKTTLLEKGGLALPVGKPISQSDKEDCKWWFFNRGIVLDVKGNNVIREKDPKANDYNWKNLITLLGRYRNERPLDGIILTIPADEIYGSHALEDSQIHLRARYLSKKILDAQDTLGIYLPVYIVVTKSDHISGFLSFVQELPKNNQQSLLGWSSPYSTSMSYTDHWLDEGFSQIERELNHLRLEIYAAKIDIHDRDSLFVFPKSLGGVKDKLKIYCHELFKPSDYHFSPILRGIYFTGSKDEESLQHLVSQNNQEVDVETLEEQRLLTEELPPSEKKDTLSSIEIDDLDDGKPKLSLVGGLEVENDQEEDQYKLSVNFQELHHLAFVKDIFEEKIFYETGLAKAIPYRFSSASKVVNTAKVGTAAFLAVSSVGLFSAYRQISHHNVHFLSVLSDVYVLMRQQEIPATSAQQKLMNFDYQIKNINSLMKEMSTNTYYSMFMPASWFSPIHNQMDSALKLAHDHMFIRTIYYELLNKTQTIFSKRPGLKDQSTSIAQLIVGTASPEYQLLRSYLEQTTELLKAFDHFNHLKSANDSDSLKFLATYCLDLHLPEDFYKNYERFRRILKDAPYNPIDHKMYHEVAKNTLFLLYDNYLNGLMSPRVSTSLLGRLQSFVLSFSVNNPQGLPKVENLLKFQQELGQGLKHIPEVGKNWFDLAYFNPGQDFLNLADMIENSPLYGKFIIDELAKKTAKAFSDFTKEMQKLVPLFVSSTKIPKKGQINPSILFFELDKYLVQLFEYDFMATPLDLKFSTEVPKDKIIYWDSKILYQAEEMVKHFEEYQKKIEPFSPNVISEGLKLVINNNLQRNVLDYIIKSESYVDAPRGVSAQQAAEEILQGKITNVREVAPKFVKLLNILRSDNLAQVFNGLKTLLSNSALKLLQQIDIGFDLTKPYIVRENNFDWWDGTEKPAFEGYNCRDAKDLKNLLEYERSKVKHWALEYAEPLIIFFNSEVMKDSRIDRVIVDKWTNIIEQIKDFEKKKPDNTITVLENFINNDMNEINLKNCFTKVPLKETQEESSDYFIARKLELRKQMRSRCEVIRRQMSIQEYEKLAEFFNENISGKFPFVKVVNKNIREEVEPEILREFFQMYKAFGGSPKEILNQIYQMENVGAIPLTFLEEMDEIREFLGQFLESKDQDNALPYWDFSVNFHTNREDEENANQIIDMYVMPDGSSKIDSYASKTRGRWTFGEPFVFGFRWPESVDLQPITDPEQSVLEIKKKDALFKFSYQWGLIAAIRLQAASVNDLTKTSYKKGTVKFEIPLTSNEKTLAFHQIDLYPSGKGSRANKTIELPVFPVKAPPLPDLVKEMADKPVLTTGRINSVGSNENDDEDQKEEEKTTEEPKEDDKEKKEEEPTPEPVAPPEDKPKAEEAKPAEPDNPKENSQPDDQPEDLGKKEAEDDQKQKAAADSQKVKDPKGAKGGKAPKAPVGGATAATAAGAANAAQSKAKSNLGKLKGKVKKKKKK